MSFLSNEGGESGDGTCMRIDNNRSIAGVHGSGMVLYKPEEGIAGQC